MPTRQVRDWDCLQSPTKRGLVLACGNPFRGDDAAAIRVAESLSCGYCDAETEIRTEVQWLPEMAEQISEAALVIFVDASTEIPAGAVCVRLLTPAEPPRQALTHATSPESLLLLARELYHAQPKEAYLVSIGGESFAQSNQLTERVRRAVPLALDRVKAILSGVSVPRQHTTMVRPAS